MSRTISPNAKSSIVLWFTGSFLLIVLLFGVKALLAYPVRNTCVAPVSYYSIDDKNHWTAVRGVYHSYREGLTQVRIVYNGTVQHFTSGMPSAPSVTVLREVIIDMRLRQNRLHSKVIEQSRKLGDMSSDQQVLQYVFPHIKPGENSTTWLYMLNGLILATGTEATPRTVCIN
ncbi:hypothetical protein [Erwinia aphidicola]|uniref:hypothetical protein n=1 Tax=Erwinia aphidicola TaxID=68334 RepID=UPI001653F822